MRANPSFAVALREEGEVLGWRRLTVLAQPQSFNFAGKCQAKILGIFAAFCRQPRRKTWAALCLVSWEQTRLLGAVRLLGTHGQVVTPQNLDWRAASVSGMVRSRSPVESKREFHPSENLRGSGVIGCLIFLRNNKLDAGRFGNFPAPTVRFDFNDCHLRSPAVGLE